tara:strand:+ start:11999 stop:12970 length:972 start_codon:yes stop_codon:yes gene_type:complete
MKILFLTGNMTAPASTMYWGSMRFLPNIELYSPSTKVNQFDIILVMTYEHHLIKDLRKINPRAKIGIIDPRSHAVIESAKLYDFIIIDSIEMEDYWRKVGVPIFRYSEFPAFKAKKKKHVQKDKIKIGYHGNQIHLNSMANTITPSLSNLGKNYDLELIVSYKGAPPSTMEKWYPKNIKTTFVQWNMGIFDNELADCDIGISPNKIPFKEKPPFAHTIKNNYNCSEDDYLLRFKMPTNPGRIIVFGFLGIPVIADFYPSAFQILSDDRGIVCHSQESWEYNLRMLILDHEKRQFFSDKLQKYVYKKYNFMDQNKDLIKFLEEL